MSRFSKLPVSLATGFVLVFLVIIAGITAMVMEWLTPCCGLGGLWSFLFVFLVLPALGIPALVLTVIGLIAWWAKRQREDVG